MPNKFPKPWQKAVSTPATVRQPVFAVRGAGLSRSRVPSAPVPHITNPQQRQRGA